MPIPIENTVSLPIEDLKTIIHGLKMSSLSFVEVDAVDEIKSMIASLPGPEELNSYATNPTSLKYIQENIGGVMRLIELYSQRNNEYKTRYKSRTGLPPRYRVLDVENNVMANKNKLVKSLVKLSCEADSDGLSNFAIDLLSCAKDVRDNNIIPIKELYATTMSFIKQAGFRNSGLFKEAQALTDINMSMDDITNGLNEIGAWFDSVMGSISDKYNYMSQNPQTKGYMDQMKGIWQQVAQLKQSTDIEIEKVGKVTSEVEQAMEQLVPQSVFHEGKSYPIEFIPDTDEGQEGWEKAVTTIDGQTYTVERDEAGKNVLGPPVESATQQNVDQDQDQDQATTEIGTEQEVGADGETPEGTEPVTDGTTTAQPPNETGQSPADTSGLGTLTRSQLSQLIQKAIPKVWQEGYKNKAVNLLSDEEMRQAVKENVSQGSLPGYVEIYKKKASNIFNMKTYSSKINALS